MQLNTIYLNINLRNRTLSKNKKIIKFNRLLSFYEQKINFKII